MGRWDDPKRLTSLEYIDWDTSYEPAVHQEGRMHWDADNQTLSIGMLGGDVELQIGQEHYIYAFNQTGETLANGKAVYVIDAGDSKVKISLADSDPTDAIPEAVAIGVTTEAIEHGTSGFVTVQGLVRGFDTSHLAEGAISWLDTTPGEITDDISDVDAPNLKIAMGYCVYSHNNNGIFLVNVTNVPRMAGLSDVKLEAPGTNGQVYQWVAAASRFELQTSVMIPEITTPTPLDSVGRLYTKADNKLYFQDGAGSEHEVTLTT